MSSCEVLLTPNRVFRFFTAAYLFFTTWAYARVGESLAQCEVRYGKAISVSKESGIASFNKAGLNITAKFKAGFCELIMFQHDDASKEQPASELTPGEIDALLRSNELETWQEKKPLLQGRYWQSWGANYRALYNSETHALTVCTKGAWIHAIASYENRDKERLADF